MKVNAYVIKTAQLNAAKEGGKFSESYEKEATTCFFNPEDLKEWNLKEETNVKCINHENNENVILQVKSSRFVRSNCVNLVESPWISNFLNPRIKVAEIEVLPTGEKPKKIDELLPRLKGGQS